MTTALQQQVFALDARYNAQRTPNNPNFSKLQTTFNKKYCYLLYIVYF